MKLTSYSGNNIKCLGSVHLMVKKKCQTSYQDTKFYLVDVTGPAVIGLPSCKKLEIVQLNLDVINNPAKATPQQQIKGIADLKSRFPHCFDDIRCFVGEEKLYIKPDAQPFIDPPRKYPIHKGSKIQ